MPSYRYESKNASGQVSSGVIAAQSLAAASQMIRSRGEYIIALAPAEDGRRKGQSFSFSLGPGLKDVQSFTSQLAVMIRAGISLRAAVEGISEQTPNPKFKEMLVQIRKDVESGRQFSDALQRYPKTFSPLYINMIKASELSGGFSRMLDRIAVYLDQQIDTRNQVRGAMVYPGIIAFMAVSAPANDEEAKAMVAYLSQYWKPDLPPQRPVLAPPPPGALPAKGGVPRK